MNEMLISPSQDTCNALDDKAQTMNALLNYEPEVIMRGESSESTDSECNTKKKPAQVKPSNQEEETKKPPKIKKKLPKVVMNVAGTLF